MRALVTGGTGFIGANVAAALVAEGYAVRMLHRPTSSLAALAGIEVEHAIGDVLDGEAVLAAVQGCDLVFHVAAVSSYWRTSREQVYRVNVQGTREVVSASLKAGVQRLVYTSTIAAIGIPPRGTIGNEELAFTPKASKFAYGHSKHLAEAEVQRGVAQGLPAVIVNPAVTIGPRDLNFISGSVIREAYHRRLSVIFPGGTAVVGAEDVAWGHLAAAQKGRAGERYILAGENLTCREAFETIAAVVGVPPPRLLIPRLLLGPLALIVDAFNAVHPGPPLISGEQIHLSGEELYFDASKAIRELGFRPSPFREAVSQAFAWYRENGYL
jgi:dihydroflavonol-4-reductase